MAASKELGDLLAIRLLLQFANHFVVGSLLETLINKDANYSTIMRIHPRWALVAHQKQAY